MRPSIDLSLSYHLQHLRRHEVLRRPLDRRSCCLALRRSGLRASRLRCALLLHPEYITHLHFLLEPLSLTNEFLLPADTSLVFAPEFGASGASLVAALPGDGSSADVTALFPKFGTGVPTQIVYGDWCISANGVVPQSSSQTLYIADCDSEDETQLWTINEAPATVSNADGNCITLGRAARGVPVSVRCSDSWFCLRLFVGGADADAGMG